MSSDKYEDIINLKRPVSKSHAPMSRSDRAAQFSPFAALTGYEEAVKEEGRVTLDRAELSDDKKAFLNRQLIEIKEHAGEAFIVEITYFKPDEKKDGGEYVTYKGSVKKMDETARALVMEDKTRILIEDIFKISLPENQ